MRTFPFDFLSQIYQTEDYVVINREEAPGPRVIHSDDDPPETIIPSFRGYSQGHWEDNTLVVVTTHIRGDTGSMLSLKPQSA